MVLQVPLGNQTRAFNIVLVSQLKNQSDSRGDASPVQWLIVRVGAEPLGKRIVKNSLSRLKVFTQGTIQGPCGASLDEMFGPTINHNIRLACLVVGG